MPSRIKPKHPRPPTSCVECGKVSRKAGHLCAECLGYESNALTGGRWEFDQRRRVMVYRQTLTVVPPITTDRWSRQEAARRAAEDASFTDSELRRARAAYKQGDRGEWATTGNRVYYRRMARARRARQEAS